jgi:predicted acylesterase/phospholipase RssA
MRIDCAALMGLVIAFGLNACADTANMRMCAEKTGSAGGACEYNASAQSSYRFSPKPKKDTLVIVTLSGGGARAAALGFGTLQMLDQLDGVSGNNADTERSLLDQVDIISSVSGGSVMAGWYALNGKSALATTGEDARLWEFLNTDWMGQLIWKGLNPVALARYSRDRAWLLKTNWGLGKHQAQDIADIAKVIMKNSADLARFYKDLNKTPKALDGDKDFTGVCQSLAAHSN